MDIIKNTLLVAGFAILIPACVPASDPYADSDGDGMIDSWENRYGLNANDPGDANSDSDGDGLTNLQESQYGSNPNSSDSDSDNLSDGAEVNDYGTHPARADTDNDGLNDDVELGLGTNPLEDDTDGDGLIDGDEQPLGADPLDPDSDGDSISDGDEVHTYSTNPASTDSDSDGLSDPDEINIHGTSPINPDTDGDTLTDHDEVSGTSLNAVFAGATLEPRTSALSADTDGDGGTDAVELDGSLNDGVPTDPTDYADVPAYTPITWWYESFERASIPDSFAVVAGGWEVVAGDSASGSQSLKSQALSSNETAEIEFVGNFVAGDLKFDYRLAAEYPDDVMRIYVDGVQKWVPEKETKTLTWQPFNIALEAGFHTIKWVFDNKGYNGNGADSLFIDNLRFEISDLEADYDGDLMPDIWEAQYELNRLNPGNGADDGDNDGLTALEEYQAGTNPLVADTDGDGLFDGVEVNTYGTNPLRVDSDSDGLGDVAEIGGVTNPLLIDSDGDNYSDGFEVTTGTDPLDNASHTAAAENYFVSFPEADVVDWTPFNRRDGWVRNPFDGAFLMGGAPISTSQIAEWTRSFTAGTVSFDYTAVKKVPGYNYTIKVYLDDIEVVDIDPGDATALEVQWGGGSRSFTVSAGEHTVRWEVQILTPVYRYEMGLYINNLHFLGNASL